ncbi:MAG: hypothetical protein ACKOPS_27235, partial [Cyanobium sp.]
MTFNTASSFTLQASIHLTVRSIAATARVPIPVDLASGTISIRWVRFMSVLARLLHSEHRLKHTQQLIERSLRQSSQ